MRSITIIILLFLLSCKSEKKAETTPELQVETDAVDQIDASVREMWANYTDANPEFKESGLPESFYFHDNKQDANRLAELVLDGKKKASSGLYFMYDQAKVDLPKVGSKSIVTDFDGKAQTIIEITDVDTIPYRQITKAYAALDMGTNNEPLQKWKKAHWDFFASVIKESGAEPTENMLVVCERFKTIWPETIAAATPTVSFTFDDGVTNDLAGYKFAKWNSKILAHLENESLKAVFFVTGKNKLDEKGKLLLHSWNDKGHRIANHTFSHPNFNAEKNTAALFERELLRTDSIISKLSNSVKLFRFPYLKEGSARAKVDSIRNILIQNKYLNGYVTIDASDWFINQRLISKIKKVGFEHKEIDKYRDFYLQHIFERADYYEKLSYELHGRHIHHTLLLHHNLTSALFLGNLIKKFKERGWAVTDADQAYEDSIFNTIPESEFAGESLIYSLAKQSREYENALRYPAEDSRYEKGKMNKLGL